MPLRTRTSANEKASAADDGAASSAPRSSKAQATKEAPEKAAAATKSTAKAAPAKTTAQKTTAQKTTAKKAAAKEAPAKTTATKAPAKTTATKTPATKAPAKTTAAKTAPAKKAPAPIVAGGYTDDEQFLEHQREALIAERATYLEQAHNLKAEAESLVEEMEPGDIQFDEESGEGGTVTVDRERDLALSAQALLAVEEIDAALAKIASGRYGVCEGCGELIGKPRLEALPFARLCIACKSGGLSRR